MNAAVTLVTVELSQPLSGLAREEIAGPRVDWVIADGGDWLTAAVTREDRYDLVFADTWPGKFTHVDGALALVEPGGCYWPTTCSRCRAGHRITRRASMSSSHALGRWPAGIPCAWTPAAA